MGPGRSFICVTSSSAHPTPPPLTPHPHPTPVNIRDDELEHVATMHACQSPAIASSLADRRRDGTPLPPPPARK